MPVHDRCGSVVPLPDHHPVAGCTWMTSVLETGWHLVPAHYETFRIPCACGHFLTGPVHRRLLNNPPTEHRCTRCVAAVSHDHPCTSTDRSGRPNFIRPTLHQRTRDEI